MVTFKEWGVRHPARDWLWQRITAVGILLYVIAFAIYLTQMPALEFDVWHDMFAQTWLKAATLLFFLCVCYHAWIGVYNILLDYISNAGLRRSLLQIVAITLVMQVIWLGIILWSVA